ANNATANSYDYAGRVVQTTLADGSAQTATYDAAGRRTGTASLNPAGTVLATTAARFDNDGNTVSTTDARGRTTRYTYDAGGQLTAEVKPVTTSGSNTTGLGYDAAGNRTPFTDGPG